VEEIFLSAFECKWADRNTYSCTTSVFEVEMAIEKLKTHKSPGID